MKLGDVFKVKVENVPSQTTEHELRSAFSPYGTVQSVSLMSGVAEVTFTSNGIRLIDSSGLGEIRLKTTNLRFKPASK